jgi:hypothetical protein
MARNKSGKPESSQRFAIPSPEKINLLEASSEVLEAANARLQWQVNVIREAAAEVYSEVFMWFRSQYVEAITQRVRGDEAEWFRVFRQAGAEWGQLTGLPRLHEMHGRGWEAASHECGFSRDVSALLPIEKRIVEAVAAWGKRQAFLRGQAAPPETPNPVYLGGNRVGAGGEELVLTEPEDAVLAALVESRSATIDELRRKSGYEDAAKILKRIVKKFTQLAPFITLPGGRGRGGYRTTIAGN